ncbi:molecular chaperone [Edaphovirga cremea]|uniref:fimbrial biogenesis chaperone n=1 Tax=Edaphovirga cremea TaxID=2267246 RepID=UPI003988C513
MKTCNVSSRIALLFSAFVLSTLSLQAAASVVIGGTRVIYQEKEREVTVKLTNAGKSPVLAQSWIDDGNVDSKPDNISVPFMLTPPINRIDAAKSQTLRISYTGANLPQDRESVFWLNVLEIPQMTKAMAGQNKLQVAFRSRIKLFFRPQALTGDTSDAAKILTFTPQGNNVVVKNPAAYYVSLLSLTVGVGTQKEGVAGTLVPPFGSISLPFKYPNLLRAGANVEYEYINDWGATITLTSTL